MNILVSKLEQWRGMNRQLKLFLAGVLMISAATALFDITFNNYLSDMFDVSAKTRGWLEFPREMPGFLTALFIGVLFFVPETFIAAFSALCVAAALMCLSFFGDRWVAMIVLMTICSTGLHMFMPVRASVSMVLAKKDQKGRRLGQVYAVQLASGFIASAIVWVIFSHGMGSYSTVFFVGGVFALIASAFFFVMRLPDAHLQRPKVVWRKQYWLYYTLAILFGARKQMFLTFGPWVLIRVFDQSPSVFAKLWVVGAVLGVVFQPVLGILIDKLGERKILVADSVCVVLVCLGYGFSYLLPNQKVALWLLFGCYIFDQLLFGVNMARSTYLSKVAINPTHIAPTLSMGLSLDHLVSMSVPIAGGYLWVLYGHSAVFMAAAGVAVLMLIFSSMIRVPRRV